MKIDTKETGLAGTLFTSEPRTGSNHRGMRSGACLVESRELDVYYGDQQALNAVSVDIPAREVTAIIGPSGCGKSTFLRCINRMNDQIDTASVDGELTLAMVEDAMDAYATDDAEACYEIDVRDDEVDDHCIEASERVIRELISIRLDPTDADASAHVFDVTSRRLLTIRDLERVGDHAVNIAARTLYMVENDDELIF